MDKITKQVANVSTTKKLPLFGSPGKLAAALLGVPLCAGSVIFGANTIALDLFQDIMQAKKDEAAIEPSPKLEKLLDKAATDLKLSTSEKKSVKLFCTQSEISDFLGTVKYSYGAALGVPTIACAESAADLTFETDEPISAKQIQKIQELKEVSVLSDTAKLFVIAEGLVLANDPSLIASSAVSASLCTTAGFLQAAYLVRASVRRLQQAVVPIYAGSFLMWFAINFIISDLVREKVLKEEMGHLNKEYIDGGVEFYEKLETRRHLTQQLFGLDFLNIFGDSYLDGLISTRLSVLRKRKGDLSWET